jgi:hypothetical protein
MAIAPPLKIAALDTEDLPVVSAHVQDAVLRVGDIIWSPAQARFAMAMNRFAWEAPGGRGEPEHQRRRAAMHFDRVKSVKSTGFDRSAPDAIASLLAIEFEQSDPPAGSVRLVFAGGGEIVLEVECIEAQLADLGAAWQTKARPAHDLAAG